MTGTRSDTPADLRGTHRGTPGNALPGVWGTPGVCTEGNTPVPTPTADHKNHHRHAPGDEWSTFCGLPITDAFIDADRPNCPECTRVHVDALRLIVEHHGDPTELDRFAIGARRAADLLKRDPASPTPGTKGQRR